MVTDHNNDKTRERPKIPNITPTRVILQEKNNLKL